MVNFEINSFCLLVQNLLFSSDTNLCPEKLNLHVGLKLKDFLAMLPHPLAIRSNDLVIFKCRAFDTITTVFEKYKSVLKKSWNVLKFRCQIWVATLSQS